MLPITVARFAGSSAGFARFASLRPPSWTSSGLSFCSVCVSPGKYSSLYFSPSVASSLSSLAPSNCSFSLKTICRINKMLNNGFKNNDVPVKDKDGNVISKEAENLARWKGHFENILNRPEPKQVAEIPPALDFCIDPPAMEEAKAAVKLAMKSRKACREDGVTAEMLNAEETETPSLLMCIFRDLYGRAKQFLSRGRPDSLSNYPKG